MRTPTICVKKLAIYSTERNVRTPSEQRVEMKLSSCEGHQHFQWLFRTDCSDFGSGALAFADPFAIAEPPRFFNPVTSAFMP